MISAEGVRVRDPPRWQDAERIGRLSYLPPKAMARSYRSELRRREYMAADDANWKQLADEIAKRESSDAALENWATAFAALLSSTTEPDAVVSATVRLQITLGSIYYAIDNTGRN